MNDTLSTAALEAAVEKYRSEMTDELCKLIRFPSVKAPASGGAPFGKPVDDCLRYALSLAERLGFDTEYVDGYAGQADFGSGERTMGILVHLDVVPEGKGWSVPPYAGILQDGRIYGRGATDNKGALVASLYAIRACADLGLNFKKRVRVIMGCDEESGWDDIKYYKTKHRMPDFGFSPDANFPVINAEKGIFHLELAIPATGDDALIEALSGGERPNVVCPECDAVLRGQRPLKLDGFDITAEYRDGKTYLHSAGLAAHGSTPEQGVNAATRLMQCLRANGMGGSMIDLVCDCIGDKLDGSGFDVGFSDEPSGALSLNLGVLEKTDSGFRAVIDIRYPVTCSREEVEAPLAAKAAGYGAELSVMDWKRPLYVPQDHPLVKTLLAAYTEATGEPGYTLSMGGGTYARALDNAVAFGGSFPGQSEEKHGVHKQDEYADVDELVSAAKVYATVVARIQDVDI